MYPIVSLGTIGLKGRTNNEEDFNIDKERKKFSAY